MMKNFTLSIVAVMAMNTFAIAQTYDAYGPNSYKALHDTDSTFEYISKPYIGLGYSYMNVNTKDNPNDYNVDLQGDAITILAGYNINQYFALEGRYTRTIGDLNLDVDASNADIGGKYIGDMSNIALYLKPMYSSDIVTLYALLGVGHLDIIDDEDNKFQWGLGFSIDAGKDIIGNNDITFFMDYIRFNDESEYGVDQVIDAFNFGLSYKF